MKCEDCKQFGKCTHCGPELTDVFVTGLQVVDSDQPDPKTFEGELCVSVKAMSKAFKAKEMEGGLWKQKTQVF